MRTINLKCGHKLKVKEWPSQEGLAKVREHYKKYHPKTMKAMVKKSLKTKLSRGIIKHIKSNPENLDAFTHIISKTPKEWDYQVFKGTSKIGSGSAKTKADVYKKIAGIIMRSNPEKKKKNTQKYNVDSIVLFRKSVGKKEILFGIIKSVTTDKKKGGKVYLTQWYHITKKLKKVIENENDLNQLPVIYLNDKQDNLIKFMPQIIKAYQSQKVTKYTFIKRLQDVVGLSKTQAMKVWSKLKGV